MLPSMLGARVARLPTRSLPIGAMLLVTLSAAAPGSAAGSMEPRAEARELGVGHYEVDAASGTKPVVRLFGGAGEPLGTVVIAFGPTAGEQILDLSLPSGVELSITWRPAVGEIVLQDRSSGETAVKLLAEDGWRIASGSAQLFERLEPAIALAAVTAADYLHHLGHGSAATAAGDHPP
jgi:hypothetical protein